MTQYHGSYTKEEWARRRKWLNYQRARTGEGQFVDNTRMLEHIAYLRQFMSRKQIAEAAGVSETFLHDQVEGRVRRVHREHRDRVLAVTAEEITDRERFIGAQRIVRGLIARGFTMHAMATVVPLSEDSLRSITSQRNASWSGMRPWTYESFLILARKLDGERPSDYGVSSVAEKINRTRSHTKQWAPLACWDLETIHKQNATPDWTGACGTVEGYYLHLQHDVLVKNYGPNSRTGKGKMRRFVLCSPCLAARRGDVRDLTSVDYDGIWLAICERDTVRAVAARFGCSTRTVERVKKVKRKELGLT